MNDWVIARTNGILEACSDSGYLITHLKLQKLIYMSYGIHLSMGGDILKYYDFQAWPLGPVLPDIYHYFKQYGDRLISKKMRNNSGEFPISNDDASIKNTVSNYGRVSESDLINMTHIFGGAWFKASSKGIGTSLSHEDIKMDFRFG